MQNGGLSHYGGLWLKEQKIDAKLAELRRLRKTCSPQVLVRIQAKK